MDWFGYYGGPTRSPLCDLSHTAAESLRRAFTDSEFTFWHTHAHATLLEVTAELCRSFVVHYHSEWQTRGHTIQSLYEENVAATIEYSLFAKPRLGLHGMFSCNTLCFKNYTIFIFAITFYSWTNLHNFGSNMSEEIGNKTYTVFPTSPNFCAPTLPCNTSGKSD